MRLVRLFLWQRDKQSHAERTSPQEDPLPFLCVQCGLLPRGFVTGILWLYCPWVSWLVLTVWVLKCWHEMLLPPDPSLVEVSLVFFFFFKKRLPQSCMQLKGGSQHASVGLNPWLRFWCRMSSGRFSSFLSLGRGCLPYRFYIPPFLAADEVTCCCELSKNYLQFSQGRLSLRTRPLDQSWIILRTEKLFRFSVTISLEIMNGKISSSKCWVLER